LVDHNIKTHEFEAVVVVGADRAHVDAGKDYDFFDFGPHQVEVKVHGDEPAAQLLQSPLVVLDFLALLARSVGVLVDRAVGQVRKQVVEVTRVVPLRRKADKAFLVEKEVHGAHAVGNADVEAHVPLVSSDQQRLTDVLLEDTLLFVLEVVHVFDYLDAPPPTQVRGLAYPELVLVAVHVLVLNYLPVLVG